MVMMTKAMGKDILREVWRTKSRFISIFTIIAIGVGFFAGLGATSPNNKDTADAYFVQNNLFDVRLLSTIGFDDEDVDAIRRTQGVADVMPVHSADLMISTDHSASVTRIHGIPLGLSADDPAYMNQPTVLEGRLPEASGECVIDSKASTLYKIGDTVTLSAASESDDIADTLKTDAYTVVGVVRTPYYISQERGSTSVGNGTVGFFMMIPDYDFSAEVYTDLYVKAGASGGTSAFDPQYGELVDSLQNTLKRTGAQRVQVRYGDIMDEATAELDKAKQELADGVLEQEEKLADARLEIDDAKRELADGERELADSEKEYLDEIARAEQELADAREKLADGQAEYDDGAAEFYEKSKQARKALIEAQQQLDQLAGSRNDILQAADGYRMLLGAEQAVTNADAQTAANLAAAMQQVPQLAPLGDTLGQMAGLMSAGAPIPPAMQRSFLSACARARAELNRQTGGAFDLATMDEAAFNAQIGSAQQTIDDAYEELEEARKTLIAAKEKLADGHAELADGERELEGGKAEGRQKINDAKASIADAHIQIADAEMEYADGKRESDEEIADAKKKITRAEQDIADFAFPEWFIQDRGDLPGYNSYKEDADRVAAIAKVFPVFFLLVSALVCLTTMTRMVEEQRTQIGTLKALGYSNAAIISKYLIYALTASLAGSAAGLAVGFQLFPRIIYNAYGIMYTLPPLIASFRWNYAVMGTMAAVLTTVLTVLFASYKELTSAPATLMRPKAPKIGKRVLLERLPFIWRNLSFTQKVTMRNLLRYKKRMLMTVVGIAGCTALMLTGFGVKDSISAIVSKQFSDVFQYDMLAVFDGDIPPEEKENILTLVEESGYSENTAMVLQESYDIISNGQRVSSTVFVPQNADVAANFVVLRERVSGNPLSITDDGVILTEKITRLLGVTVGDTVTLRNSIGREVSARISGITENYAGHYAYMSPTVYRQLLGTPPGYNSLLTVLKNPQDAAAQNLFSQKLLQNDNILMTSFTSTVRDHFSDVMKSLNYVVLVLILSAGALAFVVLYNLTNINITERIREIATIKVLGFYDKEVSAYIYRENIILTILGMLSGLGGGILLHRFVIVTAEVDMVMFSRNILPMSFVFAGALTVLFALIVNLAMYRNLQRVSMVESLKSVE